MCFALRYCWWTKSSKTGCIWSFCPSFIGFSQSQLRDKTTIHNSLASGVYCWWSFSLKKKTGEERTSIPKDLDPNNKLQHILNKNASKFPKWMSKCLHPLRQKTAKNHLQKDATRILFPLIIFQGLWMEKFSKRKKRFPKSWRPQRPQPFRNCELLVYQQLSLPTTPPPMFQPTWQWKNHWENALGDHLASRPFIAWVIVLSPKHGSCFTESLLPCFTYQSSDFPSQQRKSYQKYSSSNFHKFWVALSTFHL